MNKILGVIAIVALVIVGIVVYSCSNDKSAANSTDQIQTPPIQNVQPSTPPINETTSSESSSDSNSTALNNANNVTEDSNQKSEVQKIAENALEDSKKNNHIIRKKAGHSSKKSKSDIIAHKETQKDTQYKKDTKKSTSNEARDTNKDETQRTDSTKQTDETTESNESQNTQSEETNSSDESSKIADSTQDSTEDESKEDSQSSETQDTTEDVAENEESTQTKDANNQTKRADSTKQTDETTESNESQNTQNEETNSSDESSKIADSTQDSTEDSTQNESKEDSTQKEKSSNETANVLESSQTCQVAPKCNNADVSKSFVSITLETHAMVRADEELKANGKEARARFLELWDKTKDDILPKLTSYVSNIKDYGLNDDKTLRFCNANYYTEVLEDFGEGWTDKKGDKSPIYSATYEVSCQNNKPNINIIQDSIRITNMDYDAFDRIVQLESKKADLKTPPKCDSKEVYDHIKNASFEYHAIARAEEQERIYGVDARDNFVNLWNRTQDIVKQKLTSHVSNVRDLGIDSKNARVCEANYYTEVLEDFGNGWTDKKGETSPTYIIYYNVGYSNNKEDIFVKITAQNRQK